MAKVRLGAKPKSFTSPTGEFSFVDENDKVVRGKLLMTWVYRTRKDYGELMDEFYSAAKVAAPAADADGAEVSLSMAQALAKLDGQQADWIMRVATGWDVESEFTRDNVAQLCNEAPGAALEILNSYRAACLEGRLGN